MCDACGCGDRKVVPVEVHAHLLADNDRVAAHNRAHFAAAGVLCVNLMGSPRKDPGSRARSNPGPAS